MVTVVAIASISAGHSFGTVAVNRHAGIGVVIAVGKRRGLLLS
jgi:hypothetical protein